MIILNKMKALLLMLLYSQILCLIKFDLLNIYYNSFGREEWDSLTVCFWLKPHLTRKNEKRDFFLFDLYDYSLPHFLNEIEFIYTPFTSSNFMLGCGYDQRICMLGMSSNYCDLVYVTQDRYIESEIKADLVNSPNKFRNICYTLEIIVDVSQNIDVTSSIRIIESIRYEYIHSSVKLHKYKADEMIYNFIINDEASSIVNIQFLRNANSNNGFDSARFLSYSGLSSYVNSVSLYNSLKRKISNSFECTNYSIVTDICSNEKSEMKEYLMVNLSDIKDFMFAINPLNCYASEEGSNDDYSYCSEAKVQKLLESKGDLEICINSSEKEGFTGFDNCIMKDIDMFNLFYLDIFFKDQATNFNSLLVREKSTQTPLFYYEMEGVYLKRSYVTLSTDFNFPFNSMSCFCFWAYFESITTEDRVKFGFESNNLNLSFIKDKATYKSEFVTYQDAWVYSCYFIENSVSSLSLSTLSSNKANSVSMINMVIPIKFLKNGVIIDFDYSLASATVNKVLMICKFRSEMTFTINQLSIISVKPKSMGSFSKILMNAGIKQGMSPEESKKSNYFLSNKLFYFQLLYYNHNGKVLLSMKILESLWYDLNTNFVPNITIIVTVEGGPRILEFQISDLIQGTWMQSLITAPVNQAVLSFSVEFFEESSSKRILQHLVYMSIENSVITNNANKFVSKLSKDQFLFQSDRKTSYYMISLRVAIPDFMKCLFPHEKDLSGSKVIKQIFKFNYTTLIPCLFINNLFVYFQSYSFLDKHLILKEDFEKSDSVEVGVLLTFTKDDLEATYLGFFPSLTVSIKEDKELEECSAQIQTECYEAQINLKESLYTFKIVLFLRINPENYEITSGIHYINKSYVVQVFLIKLLRDADTLLNQTYYHTIKNSQVNFPLISDNWYDLSNFSQLAPINQDCQTLDDVLVYFKTTLRYQTKNNYSKITLSLFETSIVFSFKEVCLGSVTIADNQPNPSYEISFFQTPKILSWGDSLDKKIKIELETVEFNIWTLNFKTFLDQYNDLSAKDIVYVNLNYSGTKLDQIEIQMIYGLSNQALLINQNVQKKCSYTLISNSKDYSNNLVFLSCMSVIYYIDYEMSLEKSVVLSFNFRVSDSIQISRSLTLINTKDFDKDFSINILTVDTSLYFSVLWVPSYTQDLNAVLYDCEITCASRTCEYKYQEWKRLSLLKQNVENKFDLRLSHKDIETNCTLSMLCFISAADLFSVQSKPFFISRVESSIDVVEYAIPELIPQIRRLNNAIANELGLKVYSSIIQAILNYIFKLLEFKETNDYAFLDSDNVLSDFKSMQECQSDISNICLIKLISKYHEEVDDNLINLLFKLDRVKNSPLISNVMEVFKDLITYNLEYMRSTKQSTLYISQPWIQYYHLKLDYDSLKIRDGTKIIDINNVRIKFNLNEVDPLEDLYVNMLKINDSPEVDPNTRYFTKECYLVSIVSYPFSVEETMNPIEPKYHNLTYQILSQETKYLVTSSNGVWDSKIYVDMSNLFFYITSLNFEKIRLLSSDYAGNYNGLSISFSNNVMIKIILAMLLALICLVFIVFPRDIYNNDFYINECKEVYCHHHLKVLMNLLDYIKIADIGFEITRESIISNFLRKVSHKNDTHKKILSLLKIFISIIEKRYSTALKDYFLEECLADPDFQYIVYIISNSQLIFKISEKIISECEDSIQFHVSNYKQLKDQMMSQDKGKVIAQRLVEIDVEKEFPDTASIKRPLTHQESKILKDIQWNVDKAILLQLQEKLDLLKVKLFCRHHKIPEEFENRVACSNDKYYFKIDVYSNEDHSKESSYKSTKKIRESHNNNFSNTNSLYSDSEFPKLKMLLIFFTYQFSQDVAVENYFLSFTNKRYELHREKSQDERFFLDKPKINLMTKLNFDVFFEESLFPQEAIKYFKDLLKEVNLGVFYKSIIRFQKLFVYILLNYHDLLRIFTHNQKENKTNIAIIFTFKYFMIVHIFIYFEIMLDDLSMIQIGFTVLICVNLFIVCLRNIMQKYDVNVDCEAEKYRFMKMKARASMGLGYSVIIFMFLFGSTYSINYDKCVLHIILYDVALLIVVDLIFLETLLSLYKTILIHFLIHKGSNPVKSLILKLMSCFEFIFNLMRYKED